MEQARPLPPSRASRLSRAEQVALELEDELLARRLPIGAHLGRRAEIMARFAISPTIMNEVLRILRTRGLVDVRRGTGGGLFVASLLPQIRLGAMDLWFYETSTHPLDLFEARVHLEGALTPAAFHRCGPDDAAAMSLAADRLSDAGDARSYLGAVMALHRAIATASGITVLDGMHQTLVTTIEATLSRAEWVAGHAEPLRHSIGVHQGLVAAIADRDPVVFAKLLRMHAQDLVRAEDPRQSPQM